MVTGTGGGTSTASGSRRVQRWRGDRQRGAGTPGRHAEQAWWRTEDGGAVMERRDAAACDGVGLAGAAKSCSNNDGMAAGRAAKTGRP